MATATDTRVNLIRLSRVCELYFQSSGSFASFGHGSVSSAAETIATHGDEVIEIQTASISGDPDEALKDMAKYNRRLRNLAEAAGYAASELAFNGRGIATATMVKR